jgi:pimeloyl-ACP methyl ester carboxylesterase
MPYIDHIYYEEAGAGHPVILVHCPALSHVYWHPVMERLRHSCHAIAVDIRGHGRSGLRRRPWTFREIGSDVIRLTEQLGLEKPLIVGYSSGGCIALEAALAHQDLFTGLVLVGGLSECTTLHLTLKVNLGLAAVSLGLTPLVGRSIAKTNHADKAHYRALLPHAQSVSPAALRSFLQETRRCQLTPRLGEIRLPVLLVYGTKDDVMHEYYRLLRTELPAATAVLVPQAAHHIPTAKPMETADLITEFLASHTEEVPLDPTALPMPSPDHPTLTEHQLH